MAIWTKFRTLDPRLIRDTLNIKIPVIRTRHLMYTVTTLYEQYIICYLNPKQSHIKKLQRDSKLVRSKNQPQSTITANKPPTAPQRGGGCMSVAIDRHSVTEAHSNFLVLLMYLLITAKSDQSRTWMV